MTKATKYEATNRSYGDITPNRQSEWEEQLDLILGDFEREFDRCNGNYKYNRKPIVARINKLLQSKLEEAYQQGKLDEDKFLLKQRYLKDAIMYHYLRPKDYKKIIKETK